MTSWIDDENADELDLGFDTSEVDTTKGGSFDPLPAGTYPIVVSTAKITPTKDKQSAQAVLELTVSEGEYHGRKLWGRHTVKTTRSDEGMQKSLEIGRRHIAELFAAVGVGGSNLGAVIGAEAQVKVKVRPAANGYDASNDVQGYRPLGGAASAAAPTAAPKPGAPKPAARPGAPSFMRKG